MKIAADQISAPAEEIVDRVMVSRQTLHMLAMDMPLSGTRRQPSMVWIGAFAFVRDFTVNWMAGVGQVKRGLTSLERCILKTCGVDGSRTTGRW